MEPTPQLPDDVESLKSLIAAHLQTILEQSETIARLEHNNQILARLVFGKKSERRLPAAGSVPAPGWETPSRGGKRHYRCGQYRAGVFFSVHYPA